MDATASKKTLSADTPLMEEAMPQDAPPRKEPSPSPSSFAQINANAAVKDNGRLDPKKNALNTEEKTDRSDESRWASRETFFKTSLDEDGRPDWLRKSKSSNAEIAKNLEAARQEMLKISDIVMASYPKNGWLPPSEKSQKK